MHVRCIDPSRTSTQPDRFGPRRVIRKSAPYHANNQHQSGHHTASPVAPHGFVFVASIRDRVTSTPSQSILGSRQSSPDGCGCSAAVLLGGLRLDTVSMLRNISIDFFAIVWDAIWAPVARERETCVQRTYEHTHKRGLSPRQRRFARFISVCLPPVVEDQIASRPEVLCDTKINTTSTRVLFSDYDEGREACVFVTHVWHGNSQQVLRQLIVSH